MNKSVQRPDKPLAKSVLQRLQQIGEPVRSIYTERLRELKSNAREAIELLSGWEGKRAELALTQPLSDRDAQIRKLLKSRGSLLLAAPSRPPFDFTNRSHEIAEHPEASSIMLKLRR